MAFSELFIIEHIKDKNKARKAQNNEYKNDLNSPFFVNLLLIAASLVIYSKFYVTGGYPKEIGGRLLKLGLTVRTADD